MIVIPNGMVIIYNNNHHTLNEINAMVKGPIKQNKIVSGIIITTTTKTKLVQNSCKNSSIYNSIN